MHAAPAPLSRADWAALGTLPIKLGVLGVWEGAPRPSRCEVLDSLLPAHPWSTLLSPHICLLSPQGLTGPIGPPGPAGANGEKVSSSLWLAFTSHLSTCCQRRLSLLLTHS